MSSGNKFARGAGRIQIRPPQNRGHATLRPGPASTNKRTPSIYGKDGSVGAGNGPSTSSQEESFQLFPCPVTLGRPFAMFIRLQPEILEELKQAESEGHESMMKFGANASGNEIRVGSDTFQFSSAPEPGDLCDIYEKKIGDNVLMEAASIWRKLSVQRILSATEKDRVKKRTAEAEKKQRLRKSILVDPSTQMALPSTGTSEGSRKVLPKITKEPPPKKYKVSPIPFQNDMNYSKGRPLPEKIHVMEKATIPEKIQTPEKLTLQEKTSMPVSNKEVPVQSKEKIHIPAVSGVDAKKIGSATNMTDLRNFLISLLQENPKGVTIKAVEKAVGEGLSGYLERKAIEKVVKSIATFHAPGRYLLKPGVEKEIIDTSSSRPQEAAGSIRQDEPPSDKEFRSEKKFSPLQEGGLQNVAVPTEPSSSPNGEFDELIRQVEDDGKRDEEVPPKHNTSKDVSTDGSDSSSSSGSGTGSDSDSDSSESGSTDSRSASGSDSDGSSSSGSESMDEEVDIMSEDDAVNETDMKQKSKREVKGSSSSKEEKSTLAGELHDKEIPESIFSEPAAILSEENGSKTGLVTEPPKTLMDSVFGPEEEDSPMNTSFPEEDKITKINSEMITPSFQPQNNKEQKGKGSFSFVCKPGRQASGLNGVDDDAVVDDASILKGVGIQKMSGDIYMNMHQHGHNKLSTTSSKDTEKKFVGSEDESGKKVLGKGIEKTSKDISLNSETNRKQSEGSSLLGARSSTHKSNRVSHEETGANKLFVKQNDSRRAAKCAKAEIYERDRPTPEISSRGKSPVEDIAKVSDRYVEQSALLDGLSKNEKTNGDRSLEFNKSGESQVKYNKESESQQWQQRDSRDNIGMTNVSSFHHSRDADQSSAGHNKDILKSERVHNKDILKSNRVHKQSVGSTENVRIDTKHADWSSKLLESKKRKDSVGKAFPKEAESMRRIEHPKETENVDMLSGDSGRSSYFQNRSRFISDDVELGEFRDPGETEVRKSCSRTDDDGYNLPSEFGIKKKGLTPDTDGPQGVDRRSQSTLKRSPFGDRDLDDSHQILHDVKKAKRRTEENGSTDSSKQKVRSGMPQPRQSQGRHSLHDMQEIAIDVSKHAVLGSSIRMDEDLGENKKPVHNKYKVNKGPALANGTCRDDSKAENPLDVPTRQSAHIGEDPEVEFFACHEKRKSVLRGPIHSFDEYKEYCDEFRGKYSTYKRLHLAIESYKKDFETFRKDIEQAKRKDDEKKLLHTYGKVKKNYLLQRKRCKRMHRVFRVLHEELKTIKTRCKEYAVKIGQV